MKVPMVVVTREKESARGRLLYTGQLGAVFPVFFMVDIQGVLEIEDGRGEFGLAYRD